MQLPFLLPGRGLQARQDLAYLLGTGLGQDDLGRPIIEIMKFKKKKKNQSS